MKPRKKPMPSPSASSPLVLCILDGWGCAPSSEDNAITEAKTPHWDDLLKNYPHTRLEASDTFVGLPEGQMGNSEVGHMTIGCGRAFLQDLPRITHAFQEGKIPHNPMFQEFVSSLQASKGAAHLMGLLSPGGVHSHQHHFLESARLLSNQNIPVVLHFFLDGRDTPPQSAKAYVNTFFTHVVEHFQNPHLVTLGTIGGRYFAMDRDNHWDRIRKAYTCLVAGENPTSLSAEKLIESHYQKGIYDEFIPPHCFAGYQGMQDKDGLFMINFRADRARQILGALVNPGFLGFTRRVKVSFAATLGMTFYEEELTPFIPPLFPQTHAKRCLGECLSDAGLRQLRIAETEKYAHITFFLNGGREEPFPKEDRCLIPSPAVPTYDLCPEMSAQQVTDHILNSLNDKEHDVIIVNFANTDMVGHTGNLSATIKAVEAVDSCLGQLQKAVLAVGGTLLITADHGNAEQMTDPSTGSPHTAHTTNLVPFVGVSEDLKSRSFPKETGTLADIAPTILSLLGLPHENEMLGHIILPS